MSEADSLAIAAAAKKRYVASIELLTLVSNYTDVWKCCTRGFWHRLRREARIRENYDRISAALTLSDSKSTKNPTRNVPDVPGTVDYLCNISSKGPEFYCTSIHSTGFQSLSKTEIKRDTKDIEKNSNFSVGFQHSSAKCIWKHL